MDNQSSQNLVEYDLPGEKLPQNTNDINLINSYGLNLYKKNRDFIKEKIQDNWFAVIDPTTGKFIASLDPVSLSTYTREKYPNKLFFFIGLLKNNFSHISYE